MTRLRLPDAAQLAAEPVLSTLIVLEVTLVLATTELRTWNPAVLGDLHPDEDVETSAARNLFKQCAHLHETLAAYRRRLLTRLRRQRREPDFPF